MNDRAAAWFEASLHHRLWFDEHDAHDGASLPVGLCRRGDLTVVRNVSCGAIDGREVRLFDLDVMVRRDAAPAMEPGPQRMIARLIVESFADDDTATHAVTERWECAMIRAGADCWRVSVAPEGLVTMLADIVTLRDQDLELEAFNRAFEVRADDRRFASDLLDARMTELLVEHAVGCVVETVGNRILVARPAGDVPDADSLLGLTFAIAERVPEVVRSLHPAAPSGELTPGCPVGPDGVVREIDEREAGPDRFDPWPDVPSGWV
ncbi:MAG TPA: hypothetical protein VF351_04130 [Actinomycetota bacterium]